MYVYSRAADMMKAVASHIIFVAFAICTEYLSEASYIRACLFKSAARLRTNKAKFTILDIDFTLCTYYIYGYAKVDSQSYTIRSVNPNDEEGPRGQYSLFNEAKLININARTLLSIGGPGKASDLAFQALATRDKTFTIFARNAVAFLRDSEFDGLDVHWEYIPNSVQKVKLNKLLMALRQEFDNETTLRKLLLTVTVIGMSYHADRAYDVPQIDRFVDFAFVKAYDLLFQNNTLATFGAPLFYKTHPKLIPALTVNHTVLHWHALGMSYAKLVLGVSILGHYMKLLNPSQYVPGSPATPGFTAGSLYGMPSRLAYLETCVMMKSSKTYYDNVQMYPYLVRGNEWVGYENNLSLGEKVNFVKNINAAGIFFSALDEDDFSGKTCNSGRYPLLSYIKAAFEPNFNPAGTKQTNISMMIPTTETSPTEAVGNTTARSIIVDDRERTANAQYYLTIICLTVIVCGVGYFLSFSFKEYE